MKTTIIAFFTLLTITINAQDKVTRLTPDEIRKTRVAQAKNNLQLSEKQATQYEKILRKYDKLRSEIRSIPKDSAQRRVNKRNELLDKRSAEIKAIFTPEQYARYQKWAGESHFRLSPEQMKHRADSLKKK